MYGISISHHKIKLKTVFYFFKSFGYFTIKTALDFYTFDIEICDDKMIQ